MKSKKKRLHDYRGYYLSGNRYIPNDRNRMYLFFSTSRYVFIATDHTEVEISLSTIVRHEKSSNFLTLAQSNEINKFYESHFEKTLMT